MSAQQNKLQKPAKITTEFIDYNDTLLEKTNLKEIQKQTFQNSSGRPITDSTKIHGDNKIISKHENSSLHRKINFKKWKRNSDD
jgi:hypothetical protein